MLMSFRFSGITRDRGDGTAITTSLSKPDTPPIISDSGTFTKPLTSRNVHAPRLAWPDGDCWGYQLDSTGVDQSADALADWAGTGGQDVCGSFTFVWFPRREMMVYYCIDAANRCGNIDTTDVRYALGQMDDHCPPYQASWFKWPGSFEIVGKARVGDNVCV